MYKTSLLDQEYKKKLITAERAAEMVQNNSRIHFGLGLGTVKDIDKALAKRAHELRNVEIVSTVGVRSTPFETFLATESNDQVRFASAHFSAFDREMSKAGRCWYIPMMFNELPVYWQHNDSGVDIAFFQVAPMDKHGNFKLNKKARKLGLKRLCLAATTITLPVDGKKTVFSVELPEHIKKAVELL